MQITLKAGKHPREFCPVNICLPKPEKQFKALRLVDRLTEREIPCQWEVSENSLCVSWLLERLEAEGELKYEVHYEDEERPATGGRVDLIPREEEGKIEVKVNEQFFTAYRFGKEVARPFLYPLIGPFGDSITRPLPEEWTEPQDHPHHRGLWVAHGDVNGVDNWSELEGHGKVIHRSFNCLKGGPVYGLICAQNDWVSHKGEKVMEETRCIKIYNLPPEIKIIDLKVTFKATEGEVVFEDTKEAGICSVRVAVSMDGLHGGKIENSYGGIGEKETWGKRAHWCDYSGEVAGKTVGIAIFDHPKNLRHPTYWHVRDYGLFSANCFGISDFESAPKGTGRYVLEAGKELQFKYRIYIHPADATQAKVKDHYHNYINPPELSLE